MKFQKQFEDFKSKIGKNFSFLNKNTDLNEVQANDQILSTDDNNEFLIKTNKQLSGKLEKGINLKLEDNMDQFNNSTNVIDRYNVMNKDLEANEMNKVEEGDVEDYEDDDDDDDENGESEQTSVGKYILTNISENLVGTANQASSKLTGLLCKLLKLFFYRNIFEFILCLFI